MYMQFREHRSGRVPGHRVIQDIQYIHQLTEPSYALVASVPQRRLLYAESYADCLQRIFEFDNDKVFI